MKFKVFISWSKSRSYQVAVALQAFLRDLFHSVEPMMSEDVDIGAPVLASLNSMLKDADFVILCMTTENWKEPWLFYEAGVVLGKSDTAHVCPYIVDFKRKRRELPDPLKQFRAISADKEGTFQLVLKINKASGEAVSEERLRRAFNSRWPRLNRVIMAVQTDADERTPQACVQDHRLVTECIDKHQNYVERRFHDLIDKAILAASKKSYGRGRFVDLVWNEIEISKSKFSHVNSILVGNVSEFFDQYYTKKELAETIELMESDLLLSVDPQTARARLEARMVRTLEEVFKRYNRVASDRLKECLGEG